MKKNIIYTSGGADNMPHVWALTSDRLKAYAEKLDAELVVLKKRTSDAPWWVFFDAIKDSVNRSDVEKFAWMDIDMIIGLHARSVFQYGDRFMVCEPRVPARVNPKWQAAVRSGSYGVANMRPYPVTGVASWPQGRMEKLSDWFDIGLKEKRWWGCGRKGWGDQEVLALAIWELDIPFHFFPSDFHRMQSHLTKPIPCEICHAGGKTKVRPLKIMERLMRQWEAGNR